MMRRRTPLLLAVTVCLALCALSGVHAQGSGRNASATGGARGNATKASPLPLPANPDAVCKKAAWQSFTAHNPRCAKEFFDGLNPGPECCEGLADYWGANSTRPSRNCWCDKAVWDWMAAGTKKHRINFKTFALVCSRQGYVVPYWTAGGKAGEGYCNGVAPTDKELAAASVKRIRSPEPMMGVDAWFSSLDNDGLVFASLVTGLASAVGMVALVAKPFTELALAAKDTLAAACTRGG